MPLRPLTLPLLGLLATIAAGCSDDDFGSERPVQDMTVVITQEPDLSASVKDMAAPVVDMAVVQDGPAATDDAADMP